MVVRPLEDGWRHPQEAFRFRGRREGGGVVASEDACLQLADPVQAGNDAKARLALEPLFELPLIESGVIEAAECRRQSAKRPDQPELCRDELDDDTEPRLAREVEPGLGIALHLGERITACEKLGEDVVAAEGRIGEIAGPLRRLEGVPRERTACRGCRSAVSQDCRRPSRREP